MHDDQQRDCVNRGGGGGGGIHDAGRYCSLTGARVSEDRTFEEAGDYQAQAMSNSNLGSITEKDSPTRNGVLNHDEKATTERHGKSDATSGQKSAEEIAGKLSKYTQIDLAQLSYGTQRVRPTSIAYLPKESRISEPSYPYYTSKSILSPAQSELVLSSRSRQNRYVALDMRSMSSLPFSNPHTNSHVPGNSVPYTCCCTCVGPSVPPTPSSHHTEEQDGPEGLSWRRLHMSRAKLKATATTSELLSGFAMVAMVELQINEPTAVPEWLFVMFAVCTTVLVSVHIFALMISTYLLPNIEAISKLQVSRLVTESPHERMRGFIELAWAFSTVLGLFLFLVEVAILCWVKFWDYSFTAATASTIIVIPVLIVFIAFAVHFYHSLVVYKCESSVTDMNELESIKRNLDNVAMRQSSV